MINTTQRTQRERSEATKAKLLDATIDCLVEYGYRDTSINRICNLAGVSHGGLFRHYPTRRALVGAATTEVGRRYISQMQDLLKSLPLNTDIIETIVLFCRQATRGKLGGAWREVLAHKRKRARKADDSSAEGSSLATTSGPRCGNCPTSAPPDRGHCF